MEIKMDLKNFIPTKENLVVTLKVGDKVIKNEDGSDMTITVISPHGQLAKELSYRVSRERSKLLVEKEVNDLSVAEIEQLYLDSLAESTVEWNITWNGTKPEFTTELAKKLYEDAFWIRQLIEEAKAKTMDFMTA
jgi:hypothetical protein